MPTLVEGIADRPERNSVRVGTVAQVTPLIVNLAGGTIESPGVLSSYTPVVGHVVAMIRQESTWLVLGRVVVS